MAYNHNGRYKSSDRIAPKQGENGLVFPQQIFSSTTPFQHTNQKLLPCRHARIRHHRSQTSSLKGLRGDFIAHGLSSGESTQKRGNDSILFDIVAIIIIITVIKRPPALVETFANRCKIKIMVNRRFRFLGSETTTICLRRVSIQPCAWKRGKEERFSRHGVKAEAVAAGTGTGHELATETRGVDDGPLARGEATHREPKEVDAEHLFLDRNIVSG